MASSPGEESRAGEEARAGGADRSGGADRAGGADREGVGAGSGVIADASVVRLREVGVGRSQHDAELVESAGAVVEATRARLEERKGLVGVELGATAERRLQAEVKRVAVVEVQVAIGFGVLEAQQMVAVATCPGDLLKVLLEALRAGRASWSMVRSFWTETSRLRDNEQRLLVAMAMFGTDVSLAAEERLDPDGDLHDEPWEHGQFVRALGREVTACESADPLAEAERRRRAYRRRKASFRAHDDGTGTLTITGPLISLFAVWLRLDRAARSLRSRGDERTLTQGRHDLAAALLLYATINFAELASDADEGAEGASGRGTPPAQAPDGEPAATPEPAVDAEGSREPEQEESGRQEHQEPEQPKLPGTDELVSPEDLAKLARIINAQPLVHLNVVLPYSTLTGGFPMCAGCGQPTDRPSGPGADPTAEGPPDPPPQHPGENSAQQADQDGTAGAGSPLGGSERSARQHRLRARGLRGGVAEVLGPTPFWITDGYARELALMPDTMLHRFVTDPYDGRLVERTIDPYEPDRDMRRQILATDLYSRAPSSRTASGQACQLDHVVPFGWGGGQTSELNLALLAIQLHQFKTLGYWKAEIGTRRDLTFTTLLGQVVKTRSHDYRQYITDRTARIADPAERAYVGRDLANRALYGALAAQPEHRYGPTRAQRDEDPDHLTITHSDPLTGQPRTGAGAAPETLDDIFGRDDIFGTDGPDDL